MQTDIARRLLVIMSGVSFFREVTRKRWSLDFSSDAPRIFPDDSQFLMSTDET